jgi:hypothetical protein
MHLEHTQHILKYFTIHSRNLGFRLTIHTNPQTVKTVAPPMPTVKKGECATKNLTLEKTTIPEKMRQSPNPFSDTTKSKQLIPYHQTNHPLSPNKSSSITKQITPYQQTKSKSTSTTKQITPPHSAIT